MKNYILILLLVLSGNAFAFCDWDDHECKERERQAEEQRREIQRYEDERTQRAWEDARLERERADEEARRSNLENRCSGKYQTGAGDQDYACEALDRY